MAFSTRTACLADLPAVLGVQHRAFSRVATDLLIDPKTLPPLRETLEDLKALHESGTRFFVAEEHGGGIVGSVRASEVDGCVEVGRLVVDDGWQRRGVGSALMDALECSYPDTRCFRLFTGSEAAAPLALYKELGYRETSREDLGYVVLVWLEKRRFAG